ncbi:glycosyltransferase 87 family protein [Streptomyces sp. NPDC002896]|uniref:glycosyltransferase 87 family protein n=1 Tax=Streptomyces sp. NPDC002896 TaxID=3154438 RepID=UPI003328905E
MRAPRTAAGRRLLVLVLAAAAGVFLATVPLHRDWFDLRVYYGTVGEWVHHGGDIYDYRLPGSTYGFTYPPFAAVTMLPMALLGLRTAIAVGLLLNIAAALAVLYVLAGPVLRRHGGYGWFGFAVLACLVALLEPVRDTFSFGQVNLLLLALVLGDAWLLTSGSRGSGGRARWARWAGVGIGLAAAVKLTPALFIGLLVVARRPRAAAVATAVAAGATALAAWVAPDASRFYWTEAVRDTDRIGQLAYVSNQSLQGVLARFAAPAEPDRVVWALAAVAVLCVWARRAYRAVAGGDTMAAFALTGLAACLISPITWVHHLVWLLPSLAVLADAGLRHAPGTRARRRLLATAGTVYVVLCSSVVWLWYDDASGVDGFLGSNTYVWITLGLLVWLPVRGRADGRDGRDGGSGHDRQAARNDLEFTAAEGTPPAGSRPSSPRTSGSRAAPP